MDSSPSKRRKTSPITFVSIDAPTTPSRIPVRKDGAITTPGRASYASPTKASIARHNPQLLKRLSSSGTGSRGRNLDEVFARAIQARQSIEGGKLVPADQITEGSTTQENDPPEEAYSQNARSAGRGLSAKPGRMSRSPFKPPSRMTQDTVLPSVEQVQMNPFQKTGLRRSPPVMSQDGAVLQENDNPFQKRGLRRSLPISSQPLDVLPQGSAPPEQSATPTDPLLDRVPAPVVDSVLPASEPEPPREPTPEPKAAQGINPLLSSPRRPEFSQPLQAGMFSVSPKRPPSSRKSPREELRASKVAKVAAHLFVNDAEEPRLPPTPTERGIPDPVVTTPPTGIHNTPSRRARKHKALGEKLKSSPLKPQDPQPEESAKDAESQAKFKPAKQPVKRRKLTSFLILGDPHASKKKGRDEMLKELQQLQADIALTNHENERLRLHYESQKAPPAAPKNLEELEAVLLRSIASECPFEPLPKPKSIFSSIGSFLPFSSRRTKTTISVLQKPIPSHLPIVLDDPLPYLQAFSPLTYTSNIMLLPSDASPSSEDTDRPVLQRHLISASHPSGLFNARLSMVVDSSFLTVHSLTIEKLHFSTEHELEPFMRSHCHPDTALSKDIGVVCWAMGRWVEVSILRARLWCAVTAEFGTAEGRAKSLQRKKKRKLPREVKDDTEDEEEDGKQKWTRSQLLPYMGTAVVEIASEEVEVRFEWKISFDWTGEVESAISASARVPESWQEKDDRNSLGKVPESFDRLLKQKGPLSAARTVIGLLMGG